MSEIDKEASAEQDERSGSVENGVSDAEQKPLVVGGSPVSDDVTTSGVLLEDCEIEEDGNPPKPKPESAGGATGDPELDELLDCECAPSCQTEGGVQ